MRSNITPTVKQIPSYYYPNNVGKVKELSAPILFQGGVATNVGIKAAFEKALEKETIVPGHCHFMGALSVAMLAGFLVNGETKSFFRGFTLS